MTTWTTFAPSFLFIFAGAPFIEELRGNRRLAGALAAITAAVVGVILNLAVWFTLHVLFRSITEVHAGPLRLYAIDVWSLDVAAAVLTAIAAALMFGAHVGLITTVAIMAVLGIVARLAVSAPDQASPADRAFVPAAEREVREPRQREEDHDPGHGQQHAARRTCAGC